MCGGRVSGKEVAERMSNDGFDGDMVSRCDHKCCTLGNIEKPLNVGSMRHQPPDLNIDTSIQ